MEFIPFSEALLPQAAELIAVRQRRVRQQLPLLPARYENAQEALSAVMTAWQLEKTSGVAAMDGPELIGFIFGDVTDDALRGRAAWIRLAGHCASPEADSDLIRDLYAHAAPIWLEREGCYTHFAVSFTLCEYLSAWENLAFAREQSYALKALSSEEDSSDLIDGLEIRAATPNDAEIFRSMSSIISGTQSQSPAWVPALRDHVEKMRDGYASVPLDQDALCWLAFLSGEPVGFVAFFPPAKEGFELMVPENAIELTIAGTRQQTQGKGVGKALVAHALRELQKQGIQTCVADWHIPNLLSSRFWPKREFVPHVYRMRRMIDSRILSAQIESA